MKNPYNLVYTQIAILLTLALLSGCVNINVRQQVTSDGSMTGLIDGEIDLTELYLGYDVPVENFSQYDSAMEKSICSNLTSLFGNLTNVRCNVYKGKLTMDAEFKEQNLTEDSGFYKSYSLFNTEYLLVNDANDISSEKDSSIDVGSLIQAKKKGAQVFYTLQMPGDVYEVGGGQIVYDRSVSQYVAEFDMIDAMVNGTTIYARSREPNYSTVVSIIFIGIVASFLPLFIRWLFYKKREGSLYKDGLGIFWTIAHLALIFMLNFFFMLSALIYGSFADQGWLVGGVILFPALMLCSIFLYLGFDFEVTNEGILSKQNFTDKMIKFSEIKKVEMAKMDSLLFLGDWKIVTPSGTKIHPSETWYNYHIARKGILISLKNGKSIYVLVKDIEWAMESIKGKKVRTNK